MTDRQMDSASETGGSGPTASGEPEDDFAARLRRWSAEHPDEAFEQLIPALYAELRTIAGHAMRRERPGHTLQATALVNEAYLRLVEQDPSRWRSRSQFFGVASEIMRRVLVDHARRRRAAKRDGGLRLTLEDGLASAGSATRQVDLLALDEGLGRLEALDARQARIVEMRYFAGLTVDEMAELLGVSSRTVKRDLQMARAWLRRELRGAPATAPSATTSRAPTADDG